MNLPKLITKNMFQVKKKAPRKAINLVQIPKRRKFK